MDASDRVARGFLKLNMYTIMFCAILMLLIMFLMIMMMVNMVQRKRERVARTTLYTIRQ